MKKTPNNKNTALVVLASVFVVGVVTVFWLIPFLTRDVYNPGNTVLEKILPLAEQKAEVKPEVAHSAVPEAVKAVYMSSCAATTQSFRDHLIGMIDSTELNSIIIDIKDFTGRLSFVPTNPELASFTSNNCVVNDMKEFIASLHEKNIYVIGRITSFQDPYYAKLHPELAVKRASDGGMWADRKGINYLDPGAKGAWDHLVMIAKESYGIGFDELNFDYIRFPSDGNMKDISFPYSKNQPKPVVLESFFSYLQQNLKPMGAIISADLFGMTTSNKDDLNIGQLLEPALYYFDFVAPMVYPSHYPPTWNGYKKPAEHPYDVIKISMGDGVKRALATSSIFKLPNSVPIASTTPQLYTKDKINIQKLRPWLQDFDLGAVYTADMVRAQITATYDVGLNSWMLWDASNKYTPAALHKD